MDLGLKGKTALITGGTKGIGFGIARVLVSEGCSVAVASRNSEHVRLAIEELKQINPRVEVFGKVFDLNVEREVLDGLSALAKTGIDILVTNTGGPAAGNTTEISLEQWDRGYASLIRNVIFLSSLVMGHMKEKHWGRILNITSTSAREMIPGLPVSGTFRAGLTAYVKSLAKDVGQMGILVNNLLPGPTNTARLQELALHSPQLFNTLQTQGALGRIAEPEEIGKVAAFLCSNANTYITGTDILVDGGYTNAV